MDNLTNITLSKFESELVKACQKQHEEVGCYQLYGSYFYAVCGAIIYPNITDE